jgi:hypothetical protein
MARWRPVSVTMSTSTVGLPCSVSVSGGADDDHVETYTRVVDGAGVDLGDGHGVVVAASGGVMSADGCECRCRREVNCGIGEA